MTNIVQLHNDSSSAVPNEQLKQNRLAKIARNRLRIDEALVKGITFKIAESHDELKQAYRLVHDVYKEEGYTDPHPSGLRINAYNAHPETTVFIAIKDQVVVMTMTLITDSPFGLPIDDLYIDELKPFRESNRRIGQLCALASLPECRSTNQTLPLFLMKIMRHYACEHLHLDNLMITVNPKHSLFYENLLLFNKIGGLKACQEVKEHPAYAYSLKLGTLATRYKQIYANRPPEKNLHHFFYIMQYSSIRLPEGNYPLYIWNNEKLAHFFSKENNVFGLIGDDHLSYILEQHSQYKNRAYPLSPAESVML